HSDRYFRALPTGRRFLADALEGSAPGWPAPDAAVMRYLAERGVRTLGIDSPSMGPLPAPLPSEVHGAGLQAGMIWAEGLTRLGSLPPTGAFVGFLPLNLRGGIGAPARAVATTRPQLTRRLLNSHRRMHVRDLSVPLAETLPVSWPGSGVGRHRYPYQRNRLSRLDAQYQHLLDAHTGTHLVTPASSLPASRGQLRALPANARDVLAAYEGAFGPLASSPLTADRVSLDQLAGPARVVDVRHLRDTHDKADWPASPAIDVNILHAFERDSGPLRSGEIVIFRTDYSQQCLEAAGSTHCIEEALNGEREGWPALTPGAVDRFASLGISVVAIDAPSLAPVNYPEALTTYWRMAERSIVGIEYLCHLDGLPSELFFLFAPLSIVDSHGGPGRAVAFH
ncbi:MAG: cyclase family protein, partial [Vicinamibacteraceae bacterium]